MSVTNCQDVVIPFKDLFKNITNENSYNLFDQPLTIKFFLNNPIFHNNLFFYRNDDMKNKIVYETKDKLNSITFGEFEVHTLKYKINELYIHKCCKYYEKNNTLLKRTKILNDEIIRVDSIVNKIKTEIIYNLNFTKSKEHSHYMDCKKKLCGTNYKKPLFLYQLHKINNDTKIKLVNYINDKLKANEYDNNIIIKDNEKNNIKLETLFIYFSICEILKNMLLYKNYLLCCINHINKNLFNLNTKYCLFSNIIKDRICEEDITLNKHYVEYYIFKDYYTYAIDNYNDCMCSGYIMALSKNASKWNIFPKNNDNNANNCRILSSNINNMINIINAHEQEGIYMMDKFCT